MKTPVLVLLVLAGCANRRDVPVVSVPVHTLTPYDQVIANWGPAHDCREIRNFRYCEIDEKGIVVFKNNKYFTTLEKDKDDSSVDIQVSLKGNPQFERRVVYIEPVKSKDWHLYRPYIASVLASNNLIISQRPVKHSERIKANFGKSFLRLKGSDWSMDVKGNGQSKDLMPAMASAASESLHSHQGSMISKLTMNSVPVTSFKHYAKIVK